VANGHYDTGGLRPMPRAATSEVRTPSSRHRFCSSAIYGFGLSDPATEVRPQPRMAFSDDEPPIKDQWTVTPVVPPIGNAHAAAAGDDGEWRSGGGSGCSRAALVVRRGVRHFPVPLSAVSTRTHWFNRNGGEHQPGHRITTTNPSLSTSFH
jgi:hypothetical protein